MTGYYRILSTACYLTAAICAASAVFLIEQHASPTGAIVRAVSFFWLGHAIKVYQPR